MRCRILALLFAMCLTAAGQTYTVARLSAALKSIATDPQHKAGDAELAGFLTKVKLTERLEDRLLEELQAQLRLGPKTMAVLRRLRDQSQNLPAAAAPAPPPVLRPIPIPSPEEQKAILEDVRKYALSYSQNLPDFICLEVERRYDAPPVTVGSPDWRKRDELTKRLSYFEQKEDYKLVMVNNSVSTNQDVKSAGGSQSFGDFGSMMRQVFEPVTAASFEWGAWHTWHGQRVMTFNYRVALENSRYHLMWEKSRDIVTAYHGWFEVDPTTHVVMRIAVIAENIPADFPLKGASDILEYDYEDLSGQTFLLPVKAEILMNAGDRLTKNNKEFRVYRKYSADALIKYDGDLTATPPVKH